MNLEGNHFGGLRLPMQSGDTCRLVVPYLCNLIIPFSAAELNS